ncbi:hypothetical protein COCSADRAFT_198272 [Bipolaris sorokiniana ND90Pr]|uniref:Rhodopsin domain-containing protein n=1 Tax=Cochliobolus sativus (strain ND90Pr / ATCC 201652) TaxID=665912 RepID=M2T7S5_COCSN|nr:uncharacterized protein COCSADRAFT_198272 [Bipolaris sorokiniana ND90Pr]EMD65286.1 hypothetical protein COCSADRAFT_198272 [Bipolaris sorokiniana ND90Pr]
MANAQDAVSKETRAPITLAIVAVFTVLSSVCVALRFYTRRVILRFVGPDDYMILVAHTLSLAQSGVNFAIVIAGGAGQHIEHVQDKLPTFNRLMVAVMALYNAAQIATKISLLIQYCTIFPGRSMRLISQWGIGLLLLWGIAQQALTPCICSYESVTTLTPENCVPDDIPVALNAVINMVTDFLILIIPIKPVLGLQINWVRKTYLLVVMCMGLGVCIISAVRLDMLVGSKHNWRDITWKIATIAYFSTIETSLGIMCACIPALRPLMKRVVPNMMGSSAKDTTNGAMQYGSRGTRLAEASGAKTKATLANGIYVQKDVQFHSTTELRDVSAKGPYPASDRSSDDEISLERAFPPTMAKP